MKITTTEAKRRLLQSVPGKAYHYHGDSVDMINTAYAAYMAQHHPEIRYDQIEGYALAHATAITEGA